MSLLSIRLGSAGGIIFLTGYLQKGRTRNISSCYASLSRSGPKLRFAKLVTSSGELKSYLSDGVFELMLKSPNDLEGIKCLT